MRMGDLGFMKGSGGVKVPISEELRMNDVEAEETIDGIRVQIKQGVTGLWFGTSPEMRGLLVAEHSAEAVRRAIPSALRDLGAALNDQ